MAFEGSPLIDDDVEFADIEELLAEYRQALEWLACHTKVAADCRWRQYEKLLAAIVAKVKYKDPAAPKVEEADARNAHYEIAQFRTIYRQFKDANIPAIGKKLALVAKGNVKYTEEVTDARARDTAFELFLAATFLDAGLQVSLGDEQTHLEDLRIITNTFDLFVECKRPRSEASVRKCTDHAFKQLTKRLSQADRQAFGAIAFAIDRVKNPTSAYIQAKTSSQITEALTSRTSSFISTHRNYWYLNRPSNVVMAFVQLCGSAYVGDLPLGIFSPVVTIEQFPPLLNEDGMECLKAIDHIFTALAVQEF